MRHRIKASVSAVLAMAVGMCAVGRSAVVDINAFNATPAQCVEANGLPRHDHWRSFAQVTVRTATRDMPEVLEFETDGIADVALGRAVHRFSGQVRLDIEEIPSPDPPTNHCSTGWFELNRSLQVRIPASTQGRHHWRVSLFEDTAGRPSDDDPYLITMHVTSTRALDRQSGFHKDTEFSGVATDPETSCSEVAGSVRPDTALEPASAPTHDEVPSNSHWLIYANAGRRAYVQIFALRPTRVHVAIYAKETGGAAFTGICHSEGIVATATPTGFILAALPWERHQVAFWRLEITPDDNGTTNSDLTVSVFKEPNPLQQIAKSPDDQMQSMIGLLTECFQCRTSEPPAERRQQNQTPLPPFKRLLPVALRLTTQGTFSTDQRATFLRALRAALGMWVVNCRHCNFDTLAVARVDEELWTRADIGDPTIQNMAVALHNFSRTAEGELLLRQQMGYAPAAVAGRELYVAVPAGGAGSLSICQQRTVQAPEVLRIQQALRCATGDALQNEVILTIALRPDGKTACGGSANDIACEADKELLEFNTRDYSFCLSDATESCIGNGLRHINLLHVLLHEAGHWLGLGHIEKQNAIMASSLTISRCLSEDDSQSLLDSLTSPSRLPVVRAAFRLQSAPNGHAL